ncbi:potassium channel regulator activity protein [Homalodisca vitripennis]|nr:potassium channel regulator activity protein [Homalodisca vitripennis]
MDGVMSYGGDVNTVFGRDGLRQPCDKAYVSCAYGIHNIGYVMICFGVVNAICSVVFGSIMKFIGRSPLMILGAVVHAGLVIILLYWKPHPQSPLVFFTISGLWGVGDAVWQTQVNGAECVAVSDLSGAAGSSGEKGLEPVPSNDLPSHPSSWTLDLAVALVYKVVSHSCTHHTYPEVALEEMRVAASADSRAGTPHNKNTSAITYYIMRYSKEDKILFEKSLRDYEVSSSERRHQRSAPSLIVSAVRNLVDSQSALDDEVINLRQQLPGLFIDQRAARRMWLCAAQ